MVKDTVKSVKVVAKPVVTKKVNDTAKKTEKVPDKEEFPELSDFVAPKNLP